MSSILSALQNQVPLIWIKTTEPERLIDKLPAWSKSRDLFQFDALQGLMVYNHKSSDWKIILTTVVVDEDGNTGEVPIKKLGQAIEYVMNEDHVLFIMRNAHMGIEDWFGYFSSIFSDYRHSVWEDNADKLPIQFVCLSPKDEIPDEIKGMTTACEFGLPNDTEIASMVQLVSDSLGDRVIEGQDVNKIVYAAKGLNELEIFELFLQSIRECELLSDEFVNDAKLNRWKHNGILNIIKPKFTFADVGGLDRAKDLIERANWIRNNADKAAEYGVVPLRRFLFLGPPGTGKSLICEAASSMLKLDLARASVAQAMNKFVGQSEENMRNMFAAIRAVAPIAMWIDEIGRDLSGGGSSDIVDGGTTSRVHATLLTEIQELPENVYLYAAANDIQSLAPEMLRAGRFDSILFVGFPAFEERMHIFKIHLSTIPNTEEFNYERLAELTAGFTGSEIQTLISKTRNEVSPIALRPINTDDIVQMVPLQKNRVWLRHKGRMIDMYRIAMDEHEWASTAQHSEAHYYINGTPPTRVGAQPKINRPASMVK